MLVRWWVCMGCRLVALVFYIYSMFVMSTHTRLLFSIGTFVLSLVLIYLIFFRFVGSGWSSDVGSWTVTPLVIAFSWVTTNTSITDNSLDIYAGVLGTSGSQQSSLSVSTTDITQSLPPTRTIYTSSVRMVELVWLSYASAFQMTDTSGVLYTYISGSIDESTLRQTIQRLWWNIVAFDTENDIKVHGLRGDRSRYINIPNVTYTIQQWKEKKLLVWLIVDVSTDDGRTDYWIVQADYAQYVLYKTRIMQHLQDIYQR
jgi:hypothetical protein